MSPVFSSITSELGREGTFTDKMWLATFRQTHFSERTYKMAGNLNVI